MAAVHPLRKEAAIGQCHPPLYSILLLEDVSVLNVYFRLLVGVLDLLCEAPSQTDRLNCSRLASDRIEIIPCP